MTPLSLALDGFPESLILDGELCTLLVADWSFIVKSFILVVRFLSLAWVGSLGEFLVLLEFLDDLNLFFHEFSMLQRGVS